MYFGLQVWDVTWFAVTIHLYNKLKRFNHNFLVSGRDYGNDRNSLSDRIDGEEGDGVNLFIGRGVGAVVANTCAVGCEAGASGTVEHTAITCNYLALLMLKLIPFYLERYVTFPTFSYVCPGSLLFSCMRIRSMTYFYGSFVFVLVLIGMFKKVVTVSVGSWCRWGAIWWTILIEVRGGLDVRISQALKDAIVRAVIRYGQHNGRVSAIKIIYGKSHQRASVRNSSSLLPNTQTRLCPKWR